jgi:glycosyltransferase involved in cell wall biosynthesis
LSIGSSPSYMVALLGKPDSPTDGLADYCLFLGRALDREGHPLILARVQWLERGWLAALSSLWREARKWRGQWVLVQYTALGWSRRGVPFGLLAVLRILRLRGVRIGIVFHDAVPYFARRWKERLRYAAQIYVMRSAYRLAERSILTVPVDRISWLPKSRENAVSIPVGANFSGTTHPPRNDSSSSGADVRKTVAVFCVTGGANVAPEAKTIAFAVRHAAERSPLLHLLVLGRHADDAAGPLRAELGASGVELEVHGVLGAEEIERRLSGADVLLFVRGGISSCRGSAIAGIACGLPVVAYSGSETGPPITTAGVLLAPLGDREALANALSLVLTDDALRSKLHHRSLAANEEYFSWKAIARRYLEVLSRA